MSVKLNLREIKTIDFCYIQVKVTVILRKIKFVFNISRQLSYHPSSVKIRFIVTQKFFFFFFSFPREIYIALNLFHFLIPPINSTGLEERHIYENHRASHHFVRECSLDGRLSECTTRTVVRKGKDSMENEKYWTGGESVVSSSRGS